MILGEKERAELVARYGEEVIRRYEEAPPITPGFHAQAEIWEGYRHLSPEWDKEGNCALELVHYLLGGKAYKGGEEDFWPEGLSAVAASLLVLFSDSNGWSSPTERDSTLRPWTLRMLKTSREQDGRMSVAVANKISELAGLGLEFKTAEEVAEYTKNRTPRGAWKNFITFAAAELLYSLNPDAGAEWAVPILEAAFNA